MPIYEQPNLTSGFDDLLISLSHSVPAFFPMFLIFVFGVVFIGGIISQRKRTGSSDIAMWAVIASLSTLMTTLPLTLSAGIIEGHILSIVVVVTIFSGIWFFTSQNRNEV